MKTSLQRNNLDRSDSPYLRQHQDNPVWWQEWSADIVAAAAAQARPLFVSVGYSTCHWCHVMAAEAFSDPDTADFLNRHFICVKVDRETRPDIDQQLMRFMQDQSGSGGWPLNVFLAPDLRPIFALTYAPAVPGRGMLPLRVIAARVLEYFSSHAGELQPFSPAEEKPRPAPEDRLAAGLLAALDPLHGGFGQGQKFPPHSTLLYMLYRISAGSHPELEKACRFTLDAMRRGGLHDHLQGGIFRYCVDREWAIPHFEKMLYDQAMALWCYALAYRVLADEACKTMAMGILRCLEETFALGGLFATAWDADTGHREGATYVWRYDEIKAALGDLEFARFSASYRLPEKGNFSGFIHLARRDDLPLRDCEEKLLALRRNRPQPFRDEKALCAINALVACAYVQAARFLDRPELEARAARITRELLAVFWDGVGLGHSLAGGAVQRQGFLGDAGALLLALTLLRESDAGWNGSMNALAAYTASFRREGRWIESSLEDFHAVPASWFDHPVPSSVSLATLGLARAAALNGSRAEPLDYLQPHQSDFFNVAAMFSRGLFHQFHSRKALSWDRLPANSIQLRGEPEADCFGGECRPLRLTEARP
ncbi:MAG: DUF255 domain-containing protein [Acidobacteria bacterium]|jgi:hypothetical protein|nr:DUF255 domain-containing protein [Acidobacteriota bacterium]